MSPEEAEARLSSLGPEPLSPAFDRQALQDRLTGKKGKLKMKLVDQSWIAGIGNCYSDEICHQARILPDKAVQALGQEEIHRLYTAIPFVLHEAIQVGGYMEHPLFQGDHLTGGYNE